MAEKKKIKLHEKGKIKKDIQQTKKEEKILIKKEHSYFVLIVISVIAILVLLIFFAKTSSKKPMTLEEMHLALIRGELSADEGFIYNGFSFVYFNDLWNTQVRSKGYGKTFDIQIRNSPLELEDVIISGDPLHFFGELQSRALYITFDPEDDNLSRVALAGAELSRNLGDVFGIKAYSACTKNVTGICQLRPTITCEDPYPTIYIKQAEKTAIIRDKDCIILQGDGEGVVKATERLMLGWYGVMPLNDAVS